MPTTTTNHQPADCFAVALTETTNLGLAMLIAESDDGHYQPISVVSSLREAEEIAKTDMAARVGALEDGAEPFCPSRYVVWSRGADGRYAFAREINAV